MVLTFGFILPKSQGNITDLRAFIIQLSLKMADTVSLNKILKKKPTCSMRDFDTWCAHGVLTATPIFQNHLTYWR